MTSDARVNDFLSALRLSLKGDDFIKVSLTQYQGAEKDLKSLFARKILIKKKEHLSFTYRYKTRDIVKNFEPDEGVRQIEKLLHDFAQGTLFTAGFDLSLNGKRSKPTQTRPDTLEHDKVKNRLITSEGKPYLQALSITDESGKVLKSAQDKFRQINRYVEILRPLLDPAKIRKVVDMGSGKGYLTFALYDYLAAQNDKLAVVGVEYRQDMVDLCNRIARDTGLGGLSFEQATIGDYNAQGTDVMIALHACDTATDDAIAKGITAGTELIVVAPCCHKQIRREMEKSKITNDIEFLTRHGIFMERQAEMVTDGIRALILEYFGYSVKVFEFISDAHTPKNVMITAQKKSGKRDESALQRVKEAKAYFGIGEHHLEKILKL